MADRWIGFQPDYAATRRGLDIQDRGLDLRERELTGGRGDRRAALEKALEDQAWDRMFKEKELEQRGSLAREVERGRGERAEASTERLISANEKLQFKAWWKDAPEGARQAVLDDPQGRKVAEDSLGFVPAAERYEKPVKPTKMTAADLKAGKKAIKAERPSRGVRFWDAVTPLAREGERGRIASEKEREERSRKLDERFLGQFGGIGANRRAGTADLSVGEAAKASDAKFKMGSVHVKGGKRWKVTGFDRDGEPIMDEVN